MTTIAYKDKVIATDSCWSGNGSLIVSKRSKVDVLKNGVIVAQAGDNDGRALLRLLEGISTPEGLPTGEELTRHGVDCCSIVIFPNDKRIFLLEIELSNDKRKEAQFYEISRPFIAVGSGSKIAMGAMAAGKSAKEAVKIACEYDLYTRLPVFTTKIK